MKTNRLFEQPMIYLVFGLFMLLLYVLVKLSGDDETLVTSFNFSLVLLIISFIAYWIQYTFHQGQMRINTVSKNTPRALGIAVIMVFIIFIVSTVIGIGLGYASKFMEANSLAMVGAVPQFIILNNPLMVFIVIVFFIATLETIVAVQIYDILLHSIKAEYSLKDPKVWFAAILIGIGAVINHSYSKFIPRVGQLNIHALLIVGFMFAIICLLAVHQKEMESSIYTHIMNNFLAMMYKLKDITNMFWI